VLKYVDDNDSKLLSQVVIK